MKSVEIYFEKRRRVINNLLSKNENEFSEITFHKLRVEIKKLNALLYLINYCSDDFNRKKAFKPLKIIFKQAGTIRKLYLEEKILEKYYSGYLLKKLRPGIRKQMKMKKSMFFKKLNQETIKEVNKKFKSIGKNLKALKYKNIHSFLKHKDKQLKKELKHFSFQPIRIHNFRKELKILNYIFQSQNKKFESKVISVSKKLSDLIGRWHDTYVLLYDLNNRLYKEKYNRKESTTLIKFKSNLIKEKKRLGGKINKVVAQINL